MDESFNPIAHYLLFPRVIGCREHVRFSLGFARDEAQFQLRHSRRVQAGRASRLLRTVLCRPLTIGADNSGLGQIGLELDVLPRLILQASISRKSKLPPTRLNSALNGRLIELAHMS